MRPQTVLFLALSQLSAAARYAVDDSCRPNDEFFNSLKGGFQEGLHLAENALDVMTNHAGDQWVQKMAKYVLGTENYDAKFNMARGTFSSVAGYEEEPVNIRPMIEGSGGSDEEGNQAVPVPNPDWVPIRTPEDVELYCSNRHFKDRGVNWKERSTMRPYTENNFELVKQYYRTDLVIGSGEPVPKASTMRPNIFYKIAYEAELKKNPNVDRRNFIRPKPRTPSIMDICPWFTDQARNDGWPVVDAERVERFKTDEVIAGLSDDLTPMDGLETFGVTMLHELTHTIQGGQLTDFTEDQRPPGVESCYGWRCIGELKTEKNAVLNCASLPRPLVDASYISNTEAFDLGTSTMFDAAMHAQLDSQFMSAPTEIRRSIYQHLIAPSSIHVFLSPRGRLQVSTCLEPPISPPLGGWHQTAYKRRPKDAGDHDPTWARRLMSSWGPHWKCEEASHTHDLDYISILLSVCKKMFLDVCTMVLERATINVTDLATLELLSRMPTEEASGLSHLWNLANYAYPLIQRLHVTLRLPLVVYEALAGVQDDQPGRAAESAGEDATAVACATWARAWSAVGQLPQLRNLHVWLDHDGSSSWSHVWERQVLGAGLMAVLAAHWEDRAGAESLPPVEVLFNLPKLHPALARPETHYVSESPPPPFSIERRFRLDIHGEVGADGILRTKEEADFPITRVLVYVYKYNDDPDSDWEAVTEDDIREMENYEKMLWQRGSDVNAYFEDMTSWGEAQWARI
ncbi:hypothetical protein PG991_008469 [Apiospora marii]|uniref:DUF7730 domain-containing protein n=1 Tax=Apiospora marii TaxID=335849 RepID=A0ABR1RKS3_9PEZI